MSNAKRDENRITTLICALNTDGVTPNLVYANPTNHALEVKDSNTGSNFGRVDAPRDENRVPVALAESSANDGTQVELYSDNLYNLLIQST